MYKKKRIDKSLDETVAIRTLNALTNMVKTS